MPYILMAVFGIILLASVVLPIKWILEDKKASVNEKAVFILLALFSGIFSYYFFHAYMGYSRQT